MNDIQISPSQNLEAEVARVKSNLPESEKLGTSSQEIDKSNSKLSLNNGNEKSNFEFIQEVKENLKKINDFIPVSSTGVSFEFNETDSNPIIKVIDKSNDEVIREIPSEEFREMAKALDEFAEKVSSTGVLFNKTA
ncbi:flagellar protein FlaG [Pseudoalteromonas phenolica]|uniref:Protein FlaG n=1 Tax=Pseudoalteromonas phenolica TaxID=161398 RepID=A0A0S2JZJ2_9GAMM|nr:flagellar protein FlaG [Pseudoalteromonas phenolica]ALO41425.1 Protein FlaG [Pseudoalteromonas phenolica]MBE0354029.1 flagellar protein FlaG [Pseudoalteromonas phenolica O-BC30]RXE95902.1 flagellar protein FlaG [Pseudoalteromonas phenolica O-BC30]TMO57467.1 flagellar biosynthesis protein FlaG [Pseudoalteromonas phenolica]|tara:strand:+ start:244 stop:651 length:408 start_codon:yes stop_codon:yes gene_type:complete